MRIKPILVALAGVAVLTTAACGQQTDDRVATASPIASSASAAPESVEPTASAMGSAQASLAALTPYVTLDCVSMQAMPTDAPPANATTVGDASAIMQPNGAPAVTIATDAQPATELGVGDLKVGDGAEATGSDTVTVDYCGVGLGGKTVFDSSWQRGEPASFPLDGVIPGFAQGIAGMKVGGQRLLVIPGDLAYGASGTPDGSIAPDETLVFVVQLQAVTPAGASPAAS